MRTILFNAQPFVKEDITLALESGVDGIIVAPEHVASVAALARCLVLTADDILALHLTSKEDEHQAAAHLHSRLVVLARGWEVIPVENLLAHTGQQAAPTHDAELPHPLPGLTGLALEVGTLDEARLASTVLEKGVHTLVVAPAGLPVLKTMVAAIKYQEPPQALEPAKITAITPVGMGHRVCVDTLSVFSCGQGMLVGNSAAFTFLVNAETEHNDYVAARPFRINAGAVHAYAVLPSDRTAYLEELRAGADILIVNHKGETELAVVGRVKIEKRPMLLIRAKTATAEGTVFLQNAETIRMVTPDGRAVSVVELRVGDTVLCRPDVAGRHFGLRITEAIKEV